MPIYFVVLLVILKIFAFKPTAYNATSSANLPTTEISVNQTRVFYLAPNLTDVPE